VSEESVMRSRRAGASRGRALRVRGAAADLDDIEGLGHALHLLVPVFGEVAAVGIRVLSCSAVLSARLARHAARGRAARTRTDLCGSLSSPHRLRQRSSSRAARRAHASRAPREVGCAAQRWGGMCTSETPCPRRARTGGGTCSMNDGRTSSKFSRVTSMPAGSGSAPSLVRSAFVYR